MKKRIILSGKIFMAIVITAIAVSCNDSNKNETSGSQQQIDSANIQKPAGEDVSGFKGAPSSPLENGKYTIIADSSKIEWFCVIHKGYVLLKRGDLTVKNNKIISGSFEILMDSITDIDIDYYLMKATLENTLKSDMFFDVKKYPVSTFKITNVTNKGDNRYKINGDLKIMDIVKPITFISTITTKNNTLLAKSERFSLNRTAWGVTIYSKNYPQTDDSFLFTDYIDFVITLVMTKD